MGVIHGIHGSHGKGSHALTFIWKSIIGLKKLVFDKRAEIKPSNTMGLYDLAKDALKEIPMSDIMRARLELAYDQASMLEKKVADLQVEVGRLQGALERATTENETATSKLQKLQDSMQEEVVLHKTLEFRKGLKTRGKWLAFCPKCHLPVRAQGEGYWLQCADAKCQFMSQVAFEELSSVISEVEKF